KRLAPLGNSHILSSPQSVLKRSNSSLEGCEISLMQQHLQAIVTVLSLVNPLICGAMFAQIEAGQTSATRLADATKAAVAVLVILVIAALVGAKVLHVFGVSLDAFSVAGGGVLAWIGFSMLRGNSATVTNAAKDQKRSLTPLILFAASPGTITGVITLAVVRGRSKSCAPSRTPLSRLPSFR